MIDTERIPEIIASKNRGGFKIPNVQIVAIMTPILDEAWEKFHTPKLGFMLPDMASIITKSVEYYSTEIRCFLENNLIVLK